MEEWIERLSKRSDTFGGMAACPFARKAWIQNKVAVDPEVAVYSFDPDSITPEELTEIARSMSNKEFVALEDHPYEIEMIGDVCVNYGEKALIMIQRRSELEEARKKLKPEYYKNFSDEMLKELLNR